jgi:hypothetical protein
MPLEGESDLEEVQYQKVTAFGMTKQERKQVEVEESLETLSKYLDGLFTIPGVGWKFGLDSLVGLIPGFGDTASSLVSFYILAAGVRYGVPKVTLLRMGLNIAVDYVMGMLPVVGDLFDFVWKSNKMNMDLIRQRATVSAEEAKQGKTSDWIFVSVIMLVLVGILVGTVTVSLVFMGTLLSAIWTLLTAVSSV